MHKNKRNDVVRVAEYRNGKIIVKLDADKVVLGTWAEQADVEGSYEVKNLYSSFREFYDSIRKKDLRVWKVEGSNFVLVDLFLRVIRKDGKYVFKFGNWKAVFEPGEFRVAGQRFEFYEVCDLTEEEFVSEIFNGQIICGASLAFDETKLSLISQGRKILTIQEYGYSLSQDFILIYGKLKNTEELPRWLNLVSQKLKIVGDLEVNSDGYHIKYGDYTLRFRKNWKFDKFTFKHSDLVLEIDSQEIRLMGKGYGRIVRLIGEFGFEPGRFINSVEILGYLLKKAGRQQWRGQSIEAGR